MVPGAVTDLVALPEIHLFPGYDGLQTTVTARERGYTRGALSSTVFKTHLGQGGWKGCNC